MDGLVWDHPLNRILITSCLANLTSVQHGHCILIPGWDQKRQLNNVQLINIKDK